MTTLHNIFASINGSTYVGFTALTNVRLTGGKKNPMQGLLTKLSVGIIQAAQDKDGKNNMYGNAVNKNLGAEGKQADFAPGAHVWANNVENMPLKEKDGKFYLYGIVTKVFSTEYLLDGNPIAKSDIIGLPVKKEGVQGGAEKKVFPRTYKPESLLAIRVNGREYTDITA